MGDMSALLTTEQYATLLARIDSKINAIAQLFVNDAPTNIPVGKTPVRFNPATRILEQWNGSTWGALSATYGMTVDKADTLKDTGGTYRSLSITATANAVVMRDAAGKIPGSITGDADTLDGLHAAAFATAAQGAKADDALPTTSYTAADILTKLLTVDGTGSGLDADTVDGIQGTALITTGNIAGQSVNYATSAGSATSANSANSANNANTAGGKAVTNGFAADRILCTGSNGLLGTISELTAPGGTSTVSLSSLDGDLHGLYEVVVFGRRAEVGNSAIRLQFNGDTANNYSTAATFGNSSAYANAQVGVMGSSSTILRLNFLATTGAIRNGTMWGADNDGTNHSWFHGCFSWSNTASNITSLRLFLDSGTFAAGAKVVVRRLV